MERTDTVMFEQMMKAHQRPCDIYCRLAIRESCDHYNMEFGLGVYCNEMMERIERHGGRETK